MNSIQSGINNNNNNKITTPLAIQGCCLWMDANDSSEMTIVNTNAVSEWRDKSINAYVFTSPSTVKPTFISSSQNGKSTIAFSSTNLQYFIGNNESKSFALNYSSYALFAVFKATNSSPRDGGIYNKSLYGVAGKRILLSLDNGYLNCGFLHNAIGKISNTLNSSTAYQIVSVIINRTAGLDKSYVNGTPAGSYEYNDSGENFTATTYDTLIGAYNNSSGTGIPQPGYYLNGNICEIISYKNTGMNDATRQKVEGYLSLKWNLQSNLPSSHPYYKV